MKKKPFKFKVDEKQTRDTLVNYLEQVKDIVVGYNFRKASIQIDFDFDGDQLPSVVLKITGNKEY